MKWLVLLCVAACGSSSAKEDPPAPVAAPYVGDIDNLCNVVERSGSTDLHPNDRIFKTATWLAANFKTDDARKFLAKIQPLDREAKATALETEAKRVGLAGCPLAGEWRSVSK
jgi:hypothetical protein